MLIYIIIGMLYGYSNYRVLTLHEKETDISIRWHVYAGLLWPVSMVTMLWTIYKKVINERRNEK